MMGTSTASSRRNPSMEAAARPLFVLRASKKAALMPIGVDIAMGSPPQRPDARIQKAVRDVQEEDGDDQEEGVDCRESDDDRSIKDRDGLEEQEAEAGVIENRLGDDRAGPGCCEGQSQRCHNRGRGRAQDVSGEYIAFLQSLGPSREDEILVHHLKDEISGRVGPRAEHRERDGRRRKNHVPFHVLEVVEGEHERPNQDPRNPCEHKRVANQAVLRAETRDDHVAGGSQSDRDERREGLVERGGSGRRQTSQPASWQELPLVPKDQDEDDPVNPRRNNERRYGEDRHPAVKRREGFSRHPKAEPYANDRGNDIRDGEKDKAASESFIDDVRNDHGTVGRVKLRRPPQVKPEGVERVAKRLLEERFVQALRLDRRVVRFVELLSLY